MKIQELKKEYDGKTVVDSVSFEIHKGKVTALIGPNGAGKSTVMSMISRLIAKDEGLIELEEKSLENWKSRELSKHLAILTQSNHIQMKLTVKELVAFGRFPHTGGRLTPKDREIIDQAIDYMELKEFEDRFLDELSGGQRQALTLLMATLKQPKLLLLDEHTAALDPKTAKKVLDLTEEIVDSQKLTALMVTHNMNDAIHIGNRLIMMHEGKIIYDVSGEAKKKLQVADLLQKFEEASGEKFANDRMMLAK